MYIHTWTGDEKEDDDNFSSQKEERLHTVPISVVSRSTHNIPTGDQTSGSTHNTPTGDQASGSTHNTPTGDQASGSTHNTPTGDQASGSTHYTPTGDQASGSTYNTPTGDQVSGSTHNTPTGDQASGSTHNTPTGDQASGSISVAGIKAPPVMKKRGRPKGHELTTIGLPAKKARKGTINRPQSFSKMHTSKKQEGTCTPHTLTSN